MADEKRYSGKNTIWLPLDEETKRRVRILASLRGCKIHDLARSGLERELAAMSAQERAVLEMTHQ